MMATKNNLLFIMILSTLNTTPQNMIPEWCEPKGLIFGLSERFAFRFNHFLQGTD